ncbi:hypothetical protein Tco_1169608, partial [Tanacetum coccineum]
ADRGDDGDDEESSDDDNDDDDDKDKDEEEEEEEHPASADFVPPVHRMTARISIRDEPSISLPPREEVERLLALTTPPPSPLPTRDVIRNLFDSHTSGMGVRRPMQVARECTYPDFLKCQPLNFKGTK